MADEYAKDIEYLSKFVGNIPESNRIYQKLLGKQNIRTVRDFISSIRHRIVKA